MKTITYCAAALASCAFACLPVAHAGDWLQTDFEEFDEGMIGQSFETNGLTFGNALRLGAQLNLGIDEWNPQINHWPTLFEFVDGNVMTFSNIGPGPGGIAFFTFSSFDIVPAEPVNYASINAAYQIATSSGSIDWSQNTLMLQAIRNGEVVHSVTTFTNQNPSVAFNGTWGAHQLEISGVIFDTLRVVTDGPANNGTLPAIFDNVVMTAAPIIPGDLNGDGSVGVPDLLILLANWGPCPSAPPPSGECAGFCGTTAPSGCQCDEECILFEDCCDDVCDGCAAELQFCPDNTPPCPADLTGSGSVGVADLLLLLANWG